MKTHEMRKLELKREEPKRDQGMILKATESYGSDIDEQDIVLMAKKFKGFMRKPKENLKKESSAMPRIKDCSIWKVEWEKKRDQKERKEQQKEEVPAYEKSQRKAANEAMRQVFFATWEDSSEEEDDNEVTGGPVSLIVLMDSKPGVKSDDGVHA
ncbi:hypothetical protein HAX54_027541 [Datura stramonium]|uniref:Uncharacterized protein n=1 Tax=Datura stramonium TaxID=4076 RepID=A0ABS8V2J7_DATST|nr:hypothetical protein [Datura stramonium]